MKRKIFKNKKAATVPLEFTIAFGIMLIGMTFLIVSANQMFKTHDTLDTDIMGKTSTLAEVLINNPGNPEDWYDKEKYHPYIDFSHLERIGLAHSYEDYGTLDERKVIAFFDEIPKEPDPSDSDKMYVKKGLGLENWAYNFSLEIYDDVNDEDPKWEYDPDVNYNIRKYFTRYILIKPASGMSYKGKLVVSVFV
jgi:hypothetical protein